MRRLRRVLGLKPRHVSLYRGIVPVSLKKIPCPGACIPEQGLMDEVYRGGGALDVQQDGAGQLQRDDARTGM
jgi:hypothetical protein